MKPEGWRKADLQDVAEVILGQSPPSTDVTDVELGFPFLQGNAEFGNRYPAAESWVEDPPRVAPPDSTLVSVRAPVGDVNRADAEYAIGRGLAAIVADEGAVLADYLFRVLCSSHAFYVSRRQGSTFLAINKKDLKELPVPLPPLPEQKKIAAILSSVDDAIAVTRKVFEQTKWVNKGLLQVLMSRGIGHTRFKQSGIGEIPEEWDTARVEDIADVSYGVTVNQSRREAPDRAPLLTVGALDVEDGWDLDGVSDIGVLEGDRKKYTVHPGDLLLIEGNGNPNLVGQPLIWNGEIAGALHQNHLIRVSPTAVESGWLNAALLSRSSRKQFLRRAKTSSGLYTINSTVVKNIRVPIAPKEERVRVVGNIAAFRQSTSVQSQSIESLESLKRGLMRDLLTGRVRVPVD